MTTIKFNTIMKKSILNLVIRTQTQVLPMTREALTTRPNKFFDYIIIFIILIIINIIYTY